MSFLQNLAAYRLSRYFKLGFILWDLALLNLAIVLSFLLRHGNFEEIHIQERRTLFLLMNFVWLLLLLHKDSYRIIRVERIEAILMRTIRLIVVHFFLIGTFVAVLKYSQISRLGLLYFYLIFFTMLFIFRVVFMKVLKCVRTKGYNFRNVVIVGGNDTGNTISKFLSKDLTFGYHILGFFDNTNTTAAITSPFLGGFDSIEDYVLNQKVDEMYVTLHIDQIKIINQLTALCERYMIRIKFIPDFQQYTKGNKVQIAFYGNIPVLTLRKEPLESAFNRLIKKAFDFVFAFLVIVVLFPWLFVILYILIKLDSPGPVFFRQQRSGRDNQSFYCFKFRTMQVNAQSDEKQAVKGDSRVTKLGAFMRKTNIDELPQFFNVLFGNMSVVGPRPHMLKHTEQYSELINNYLVRHYAKPGITGWAQVNGFRGETKELTDMTDRVEYDIWYIENWSLLLDLKIIFRTVINVFRGEENAY